MPFNGSGVYSLPSTTVTPAVSGTTIDSAQFNTFTADLETALTNCVTKDGQTASPILDSPKVDEILDTNGNEAIVIGATGSAVNGLKVINAATTAVPTIQTHGEADIGLDFENSESEELLKLVATATAVNEVTITNEATGNAPSIAATGDDTDIDLDLIPKGTGTVNIASATITSATISSLYAFRGCMAKTTGVILPNNTVVDLTWDGTDDYDTDSIHDPASNNTRLTVPANVTYVRLSTYVETGAGANTIYIGFDKNGAAVYSGMAREYRNYGISASDLNTLVSGPIKCTAGDYFEVHVIHNSGSTETVGSNSWFAMEILG